MHNYYFVAPSLPPLVLGKEPEMPFNEVIGRLQANLAKGDLEKIQVLRRLVDLKNIRALCLDRPLDPQGSLGQKELDEALLVQAGLPEYVFDFLSHFESPKAAMRHFFGLLSLYYTEEGKRASGFLQKLLALQREMRLVLLALRAKKAERNVAQELQYEDFTDPIVAHILAQKDTPEFEPPLEYQDLIEAVQSCGEDPWAQYKRLVAYEFEKIEELSGYPLFSIDWIIGYVARLMLVEQMNRLSDELGREQINKFKEG